ncbi:transcriptional regulator GutM [uncultured Vagococcus sp.]|uniref:transcriptional regulator GutM n=1 Tax=uncultured Vagococcus sp. TaxID=189676 RepID=UPI0028D8ED77|nr:transcriptional regulator GutM [uncultured Vagococcus sp.]
MEYWGIIALLVSCWLMQVLMSMKQSSHYQESLNEMKKLPAGHIGVGITKAKFNLGRGIVMIVATDLKGNIIELREMKGMTVFSRFKKRQPLVGKHISQLSTLVKKKERSALEQALSLINRERAKANLESLSL